MFDVEHQRFMAQVSGRVSMRARFFDHAVGCAIKWMWKVSQAILLWAMPSEFSLCGKRDRVSYV